MKLFGKKKIKVASEVNVAQDKQQNEAEVESYFSEHPTKGKKLGNDNPDIALLLAMDTSTLNSKQKRIIRRHKEREDSLNQVDSKVQETQNGKTENTQKTETEKTATVRDVEKNISIEVRKDQNDVSIIQKTEKNDWAEKLEIEEMEKRMVGLNSKERRKFLRQLAADDSESAKLFLAKATETAKRIAEENEAKHTSKKEDNANQKEEGHVQNEKKKKNGDESFASMEKGKKRKLSDLSHLPPEERERRENQRRLQQEAKIRRENGEEDLSRHPLNSERRRANRRKPGKTGKLAKFIKEKKREQQSLNEFNAGGYHIRHQKK